MQVALSSITVALLLLRLMGEHYHVLPPPFYIWLDGFALLGVLWMAVELIRRPSKH
jgi:hypothetical protein